MDRIFAVGFSDQFPCARNRYRFGIGATLFINEADAIAFKGTSLYSVSAFDVADADEAIRLHDGLQRRHAESLGAEYIAPNRTAQ